MKNENHISTIFLDIGGVLLTDGWDYEAREAASEVFNLSHKNMEEWHHLSFETYEIDKMTNRNLHVRGYKEEGTITTPFDIRVQNDIDRLHLVQDVVDRVPNLGSKGDYLKQMMKDKLIQHKHFISAHGEDMPEILDWKWNNA